MEAFHTLVASDANDTVDGALASSRAFAGAVAELTESVGVRLLTETQRTLRVYLDISLRSPAAAPVYLLSSVACNVVSDRLRRMVAYEAYFDDPFTIHIKGESSLDLVALADLVSPPHDPLRWSAYLSRVLFLLAANKDIQLDAKLTHLNTVLMRIDCSPCDAGANNDIEEQLQTTQMAHALMMFYCLLARTDLSGAETARNMLICAMTVRMTFPRLFRVTMNSEDKLLLIIVALSDVENRLNTVLLGDNVTAETAADAVRGLLYSLEEVTARMTDNESYYQVYGTTVLFPAGQSAMLLHTMLRAAKLVLQPQLNRETGVVDFDMYVKRASSPVPALLFTLEAEVQTVRGRCAALPASRKRECQTFARRTLAAAADKNEQLTDLQQTTYLIGPAARKALVEYEFGKAPVALTLLTLSIQLTQKLVPPGMSGLYGARADLVMFLARLERVCAAAKGTPAMLSESHVFVRGWMQRARELAGPAPKNNALFSLLTTGCCC